MTRPLPRADLGRMELAAILAAAGSGSRFGTETPKQFQMLMGQPVMRHAAQRLIAEGATVQPVGDPALIGDVLAGLPCLPTVPGGATRQDSVLAGLVALRPHAPRYVMVHDAARPVIPPGTIGALLAALDHAPGAIPAMPVADTLKRVQDGVIQQTVPREGLFRAQTPQAFHFDTLLSAHHAGLTGSTDDASLLEALGHTVAIGLVLAVGQSEDFNQTLMLATTTNLSTGATGGPDPIRAVLLNLFSSSARDRVCEAMFIVGECLRTQAIDLGVSVARTETGLDLTMVQSVNCGDIAVRFSVPNAQSASDDLVPRFSRGRGSRRL